MAVLIRGVNPGVQVELVALTTRPDRQSETPLAQLGGDKGLFVREIEQAVLDGRADAAVHSLKDVPVDGQTPGLKLVAFPERANPADVLISNNNVPLDRLPVGGTVATSSLRRQAQLLRLRPDLRVCDIRGNVETRLAKLRTGQFDAIIMAAAGLERLGLQDQVTQQLESEDFLPAPGQGILVVQAAESSPFAEIWQSIDNVQVRMQAECERLFSLEIGATCRSAAACMLSLEGDEAKFEGAVLSRDGKTRLHSNRRGPLADGVSLGRAVADDLLAAGCKRLL